VATTTMPIATRILKVSGSITVCPFELINPTLIPSQGASTG
jgi:hypothetical protein